MHYERCTAYIVPKYCVDTKALGKMHASRKVLRWLHNCDVLNKKIFWMQIFTVSMFTVCTYQSYPRNRRYIKWLLKVSLLCFLTLFYNQGELNDLFTLQTQNMFLENQKKIRRHKCDNRLIWISWTFIKDRILACKRPTRKYII